MQIMNMDSPADEENEDPIVNHTKKHHEKRTEKRKDTGPTKSKHSLGKPDD